MNHDARVRYWAKYPDLSDYYKQDPPTTVVRRRVVHGRLVDEEAGRRREWVPTTAVHQFENEHRFANPPHLVEIDTITAAEILREVHGAPEMIHDGMDNLP